MNKVILVKLLENNGLKMICELDTKDDVEAIAGEFNEKAKFNRDFSGTYYFILVQKIEIKRD